LKIFFFMAFLLVDAWSVGKCCIAVCAVPSELGLHLFLAHIVEFTDPGLFYLAMTIDKEKGWRCADARRIERRGNDLKRGCDRGVHIALLG